MIMTRGPSSLVLKVLLVGQATPDLLASPAAMAIQACQELKALQASGLTPLFAYRGLFGHNFFVRPLPQPGVWLDQWDYQENQAPWDRPACKDRRARQETRVRKLTSAGDERRSLSLAFPRPCRGAGKTSSALWGGARTHSVAHARTEGAPEANPGSSAGACGGRAVRPTRR